MTKARTVGQKRRSRGGRPRKDGPRYPGGQRRHSVVDAERQAKTKADSDEAMRPTLERRARTMGWVTYRVDGDEVHERMDLDSARNQRLGTLWGQLTVAGTLTPRMGEALDRYWACRQRYRAALSAPPSFAKGPALDETQRGLSGELSASQATAYRREFAEADSTLRFAGDDAKYAVDVALEDPTAAWMTYPQRQYQHLRDGARALADHFQLPEDE